MAFHEPTMTMQVLADENLLAVIMDNIDNPQTLFNLVLVLPNAKTTFERCPRQFLTATISDLAPELKLLAILHIALNQDHVTRASMIPLLWTYLSLEDTPGVVSPPIVAIDFEIPRRLSNPFETLRKLAAVWSAVEDLAVGFVESSMGFIRSCSAADAAGVATACYERGHVIQPLCNLWKVGVIFEDVPGIENIRKSRPWSLPLKASETYRVKRALWRLEIFAVVSHEPHTWPNEGAIESEDVDVYCTDPLERTYASHDYDDGTRILLASLQAFELAELESVYDYLWRETIGKVYQHKLDPYIPNSDEAPRHAPADYKAGGPSRVFEQSNYDHEEYVALFRKKNKVVRAKRDYDRYLTYLMSRGLSLLHRVQKQMTQDDGKIIPSHYPPLRYRSLAGLRDTWNDMDTSRRDDVWQRYYENQLKFVEGGHAVTRKSTPGSPMDDSPRVGSLCATYLMAQLRHDFHIKDLWRAGCYMWESR